MAVRQAPAAFRFAPRMGARALHYLFVLTFFGTSLSCLLGQEPPLAETKPPESETPTLTDARELLMAGSYSRARESYERIKSDPRLALEAGLGIAECLLQTGEHTEAAKALADLNAGNSSAWHRLLAEVLRRQGRYEETLRHCKEALTIDPNHTAARVLLGTTLEMLGRRDEAIETYRWFDEQLAGRADLPRDPAWLTDAAIGFFRYTTLTQTNVVARTKYVLRDLLQTAYDRLDRTYWPARLVAADLLREKYNNDDKDGSLSDYFAALKLNEGLPEAHVGIGEVALEGWSFEEIERRTALALATNPNFAPAIHLEAKKLIVERRYDEAAVAADRALAINGNDLTALALRAAASRCRYDEREADAMRAKVAAVNPRPALYHRIVGDALSGIRQYAASESEYLKAIEYEPTDANARTELGMMYMQWGLEDRARDALEASWKLDPFNERTKNTLELLETLEHFDKVETANFIIRYDGKSDPGLGEFVGGYLEELYAPVTSDYATKLHEKTIIEFFPSQRQFAVRITGKPWIHTVGACTGRVIALASPRRGEDRFGPYNLARVLKHEFTHTVTLAATENRIPHWFTEGLAVLQEDSPRSFDWAELLAEASRRDQLFTLQSIDWGFMRPKRPQDRSMAYAQSEWMCEYIVERWGYDTINAMIDRYRRGQTQQQVISEQLGIAMADFDRDFAEWAKKQAAPWGFDLTPPESVDELKSALEAKPDEAALHGRLARAALDDGDIELALNAAGRALELDENEPRALSILVTIIAARAKQEPSENRRRHYEDELILRAERLAQLRPDDWSAAKSLAEVLLRRRDWDKAIEPLQRWQRLCPLDPGSWQGLAAVYLAKGEEDRALSQLLELARSEEHDPTVAREIAGIYRRRQRLKEAQYWLRQSLFIDPFNVEVQALFGDTALQAGNAEEALRTYTLLTKLEPGNARRFESAALTAKKLGREDEARQWAAKAVALDPQSAAKSLLP